MGKLLVPPPSQAEQPQPLPRWTGLQSDAAFSAGAAVFALDRIIRSEPAWIGSWRMRLGLQATVAATRLLRLQTDDASLRDAQHLTRASDDPGPAGRLHGLLRRWQSRPVRLAGETEKDIAAEAGQGIGQAELLALLAADRALAEHLGWAMALPLHLMVVHDPALRQPTTGKRPLAHEAGWAEARHAVLLKAATLAHAEAVTMARRAEALTAVATSLRTRDGGRGLGLILADDCVAPWRMVGKDGLGSDRAARRLCETLHGRGALRLLTDRPTFRLYGL